MASTLARIRTVAIGWPGAPRLNTFYFLPRGEDTFHDQASVNNAAARVQTFMNGFAGATANPWQSAVQAEVDEISAEDGTVIQTWTATGTSVTLGATGEEFAPFSTCLLLKMNTLGVVHNRKVRGRAFLGPLGVGSIDNGQCTFGTADAIRGFAATMATINPANPRLAVWSRPHANGTIANPTRAGSASSVVSVSCPVKLAVLRSQRD